MKCKDHRVGGRAFNGPFAFSDLLAEYGMTKRERLRGRAAFLRWRNDRHFSDLRHGTRQRAQTRSRDAIIIGYQNMRHGFCIPGTANFRRRERALRSRMVGTTGFEPATSRTPSVRATRLRHVPTVE